MSFLTTKERMRFRILISLHPPPAFSFRMVFSDYETDDAIWLHFVADIVPFCGITCVSCVFSDLETHVVVKLSVATGTKKACRCFAWSGLGGIV